MPLDPRADTDPRRPAFSALFSTWAGRVRRRLAARHTLTGLAVGLGIALVLAAVAWRTRHGALRLYAPLAGVAGGGVGAWVARRRRWNDTDVALYLDAKLSTQETITTAVQLRGGTEESDDATRAVVLSTAAEALAAADAKRARPRLFRPVQALAPAALAGLAAIAWAPLPPAPASPTPPGTTNVRLADVEGLKKVAELGKVQARDDAQRERLDRIARDAEKLRQDLQRGIEKREAQDRIAQLRDAILAERLSLGAAEQRPGLEAAVSKLAESDRTKGAAQALGDHDLEKLDAEMEHLANQREKEDRELAKKQLQEAADAARKGGAPGVAKALEDEKKMMEEREKRSGLLRDLAKAMQDSGLGGEEVQREAEALDRKGSDEAARKLADAMGKALENLSPEERERLAKKLAEQMKRNGGKGAQDPQALKELAEDMASADGQKDLEKRLKELANEDTESEESKRQQGLDDAQEGAGEAEGELGEQGNGNGNGSKGGGQTPVPMPMPGGAGGSGKSGEPGEQGGGPSPGGGGGEHPHGTTGPVSADTLKSRARGPMNAGKPMPGTISGHTAGRAGGTANVQGTGALNAAGPGEVDGVEHSDVPEEYREQVRQYFQP